MEPIGKDRTMRAKDMSPSNEFEIQPENMNNSKGKQNMKN
jgi:hypothetical protein